LQWGRYVNTAGDVSVAVTLPVTFPTAFLVPLATPRGSATTEGNAAAYADIISTSQIRLVLDKYDTGTKSDIFLFAIGY